MIIKRTSRKQVKDILEKISDESVKYELVEKQLLGNRENYYYTYSVKKLVPKYTLFDFRTGETREVQYSTGWKFEKIVLDNMSLKEIMLNIDKLF